MRQTLVVRAEAAKTNTRRTIPVAAKLSAVLAMRKTAPDGKPHGPDAYIFGNAVGEKIGSIKKSWMTAATRTRPHASVDDRHDESSDAGVASGVKAIGLHFHDLRRECASRWLEAGVSLAEVRDLLGHANISQTSTHLKSTATSLASAIDKADRHQQQLAEAQAQREADAQVQKPLDTAEVFCDGRTQDQPGNYLHSKL